MPQGHAAQVAGACARPATKAASGASSAGRATVARTSLPSGMRLKLAHAKGLWHEPMLTLETLRLQTDDAQLQGHLNVHTVNYATQGQLALTLPGAQAKLNGHLGVDRGQGEARLQVLDAAAATRWLARWSGPANTWLAGRSVQGGLDLDGRWQGGWQHQGQDMQIEARLRACAH